MKTILSPVEPANARVVLLAVAVILLSLANAAPAADFTVTTPGSQFAFNINGTNSLTLTLVRGRTYTFTVNTTAGFHPFRVNSAGVVNNNITSGTLTYTVPMAAANYTYDCGLHGASMQGTILTVVPPVPPVIRITDLKVNSNVVLYSTGTNNWTLFPEFKTNIIATNWMAMTVQTNRFSNGTNETICGRPPGTNVFLRIRAVPN